MFGINFYYILLLLAMISKLVAGQLKIFESNYNAATLGYPHINNHASIEIFSLSNMLVKAEPFDACVPLNGNFTNSIVAINSKGCYVDIKLQNAQSAGAIAAIIFNSDGSGSIAYNNLLSDFSITIYAVEIAENFQDEIIHLIHTHNNSIAVTLNSQTNYWQYYGDSKIWLIVTLALTIFNVLLIIASLYRIYQFKSQFGKSKLCVICYIIIVLAATTRIIFSIDPNGTMLILSFPVRTIILAISFPLALTSTCIVGFYWLEVFSKRKLYKSISSLHKSIIPFSIILCVIISLMIIACILRTLFIYPNIMVSLASIIYCVSTFITFCFFTYACIRLHIWTRSFNSKKKSFTLKRLLALGYTQCICLFLFILFICLSFIPNFTKPIPFLFEFPILNTIMTAFSCLQAAMFKLPSNSNSTYTSGKNDASASAEHTKNRATKRDETVPSPLYSHNNATSFE